MFKSINIPLSLIVCLAVNVLMCLVSSSLDFTDFDIRKVFTKARGSRMVTNVRLASCFLQKIEALLVTVKCSPDKSLEDEWPQYSTLGGEQELQEAVVIL